ncbi:MAG TPA: EVE domain-containing protein [Dehalococcoidia bacterium]|nr:EVE domain-containing protein [Dehalococcoidia bacterium]
MKYWLNVVSREHVLLGAEGGFTQAQHGSPAGLRRLSRGDGIVFYSPRTALHGEPLRRFTAAGRILDDKPYQVEMSPSFHPWRRDVALTESKEAPIEPLIPKLDFITDKQRWGFPLRRGLLEISREDFRLIEDAMGIDAAAEP